MATIRAIAPAKINLTLHVTGQRDDGYHLLDSLVVFAGVCDQLGATISPDLKMSVTGPFSTGVPIDDTNLMMRAAQLLRRTRGVTKGAVLTLEKHLPHAAGIGSGSCDAAVTLAMLADLWGVAPLAATDPAVAALGADVPVCLAAPNPMRMSGIGDILAPVPRLPSCAIVLVRPKVAVPTAQVFAKMSNKNGAPMTEIPAKADYDTFITWLRDQRNDMQAAAAQIAPEITAVIAKLKSLPGVSVAGMSGSGATCFGLVKDMATARHVARIVQVSQMDWWVAPAEVLGTEHVF